MSAKFRVLIPVIVFSATWVLPHAEEPLAPVDLTVRVLSEAGEPQAGVEVHCVRWSYEGYPRTEPLSGAERATTAGDGTCRFPQLGEPEYVVRAVSGTWSAWKRVDPHQPEVNPVELRLEALPPVRGYVRDLKGTPLDGVSITGETCMPLAVTDEQGHFVIPGMNGTRLSFYKNGYGWLSWDFPEGDMEIGLEPGTAVLFRIHDQDGQPVPEAELEYRVPDHSSIRVITDEKGESGPVFLASGAELNASVSRYTEESRWHGELNTKVESGPEQVIEIVATQTAVPKPAPDGTPPPPPPDNAYITGRVVKAGTNEPVTADLYVSNSQSFDGARRRGKTKSDGTFRLERQQPPVLFLCAAPDDRMLYPVEGLVRVDLRSGPVENLVLTAAPGVAISGRALDAKGQPVEGNWVMLQSKDITYRTALTEVDGHFSFGNLAPFDAPAKIIFGNVSVEAGPLTVGQTADDLVLQLPAPAEQFTIRGVVVDETGAPVAGADVNLQKGLRGNPNHGFAHGTADGLGRFAATFEENMLPGPVEATVHAKMQFKMASFDQRTGRTCAILEGGDIEDASLGNVPEMRIVVKVPPILALGGYVEDAEGHPIRPEIKVCYGDYKSDRIDCDEQGHFFTHRLPEQPFLLEFTLEDHQARILELGRDFEVNDRGIHVVLKEGPFSGDTSIWTAATGKPDTEEAIKSTIQGERIKRREQEYDRLASASIDEKRAQEEAANRPQPPPRPQAPAELRVQVVDSKGQPVQRIVVQRASPPQTHSTMPELRRDNATVWPDTPSEILSDNAGLYTVPNGSFLTAPEVGRALVFVKADEAYTEPMAVTLAPPASITVQAKDYDGVAQEGLVVVHAADVWALEGTNFYKCPKTDAKGQVVMEPLVPGDYILCVRATRTFKDGEAVAPAFEPVYVAAHVEAGQHVTCAVTVGTPKTGSPEATLAQLMAALKNRRSKLDELQLPPKPERKEVAAVIRKRVDAMAQVLPQQRDEIQQMAQIARALEDKSLAKPFEDFLLRADRNAAWEWWFGGWPSEVVDTITALEGNGCIGFLETLAQKTSVAPKIRAEAVVGLGRLGTPESVAAFVRLRDAAFAKPGAPARKQSYTHAEKMAEAVTMTFFIIPDSPHTLQVHVNSANIDADYKSGTISMGDVLTTGSTTLRLRRFGAEWIVTQIESSMIV